MTLAARHRFDSSVAKHGQVLERTTRDLRDAETRRGASEIGAISQTSNYRRHIRAQVDALQKPQQTRWQREKKIIA